MLAEVPVRVHKPQLNCIDWKNSGAQFARVSSPFLALARFWAGSVSE